MVAWQLTALHISSPCQRGTNKPAALFLHHAPNSHLLQEAPCQQHASAFTPDSVPMAACSPVLVEEELLPGRAPLALPNSPDAVALAKSDTKLSSPALRVSSAGGSMQTEWGSSELHV